MLGDSQAGEDATDESGARLSAGHFEVAGLLLVHQFEGDQLTGARDRRITERQREFRETVVVLHSEVGPRANLRRLEGQRRGVLPLADNEILVAARIRQLQRRIAADQRCIHQVELHERDTHELRVHVDMVDAHVEGEVIVELDDAEGEAVPLHRRRSGPDEVPELVVAHHTVLGGNELDVGRTVHLVPDDLVLTVVLEPAAVGVVTTNVGVDHVVHRTQIALSRCVVRGDHQPRVVESLGGILRVPTDVLRLHVSRRYRADGCFRRLGARGSRRVPGDYRACTNSPLIDRSDRHRAD